MNGPNLLERRFYLGLIDVYEMTQGKSRRSRTPGEARQLLAPGHLVYFKYKLYWAELLIIRAVVN